MVEPFVPQRSRSVNCVRHNTKRRGRLRSLCPPACGQTPSVWHLRVLGKPHCGQFTHLYLESATFGKPHCGQFTHLYLGSATFGKQSWIPIEGKLTFGRRRSPGCATPPDYQILPVKGNIGGVRNVGGAQTPQGASQRAFTSKFNSARRPTIGCMVQNRAFQKGGGAHPCRLRKGRG